MTAQRVAPNVALRPLAARTAAGTIVGRVLNAQNSRGLAHVRVQLVDADNDIVGRATTNARGVYRFNVPETGAYVVRLAALRRWVQVSPTFTTHEPEGAYSINPATGQPHNSSSWNYWTGNNDPANGPVGPGAWEVIAPAGGLPFQSPIDIAATPVDLSPYLQIHYAAAAPATIINNGAQIQVQFSDVASGIQLNGEEFTLKQFHFHDPSEHQVDGRVYPMEAHFVNSSASGVETVVSVFLQLGDHNPALQPILDAATTHLTTPGTSTTTPSVALASLLPSSLLGWFYLGSFTTPPLAAVANWLVLKDAITLDFAQLSQYESVARNSGFQPNARPLQPSDGREVNRFGILLNFQGGTVKRQNFVIERRGPIAMPSVRTRGRHKIDDLRLVAQLGRDARGDGRDLV